MILRLLACLLLLTLRSPGFAQTPRAPALTLTIIPTTYRSRTSSIPSISFYQRGHFHVLLTNVSADSVVLFEEWNSWGYYGLSFEVTYPDGRHQMLTRAGRGWNRNFPSTLTLAPQGYYVFEVSFDDTWEPAIRRTAPSREAIACRLRAIYSIDLDPQDRLLLVDQQKHLWTGTVTSPESAYLLWP